MPHTHKPRSSLSGPTPH